MFDKDTINRIYEECVALTKRMVAVPSINSTIGEAFFADFLVQELKTYSYFSANPNNILVQDLGDEYGRKNVYAIFKGNGKTNKTVILHGHLDTVDIENYGSLSEFAFDCDELLNRMLDINYDTETNEDLKSGKYMVGRGVCDMKCGLALAMVILKIISESPEKFDGNLIFMANPGEELLHNGIIGSVDFLLDLQSKYELKLSAAISMDCSNPHYVGDTNNYIYYGTVGKILPCVYVLGKETHIGQCFNGVDASSIAMKLAQRIHLNMDYADKYHDEVTLPPSLLRYEDNKTHYSVNTVAWSYIYFNFLLYSVSPMDIMKKIRQEIDDVVKEVLEGIDKNYKIHCDLNNREYSPISYTITVLEYEELYDIFSYKLGSKAAADIFITECVNEHLNEDKRDVSRIVVQAMLDKCDYKENTIVLFLTPPFMPHSTLLFESQEESKLADALSKALDSLNKKENLNIKHIPFYPSLSDSSYLKMDDSSDNITFLEKNTVAYEDMGVIPFSSIKALNIPAMNMGCYGKDPHRNTERLDTDYSFRTLPQVIVEMIDTILES